MYIIPFRPCGRTAQSRQRPRLALVVLVAAVCAVLTGRAEAWPSRNGTLGAVQLFQRAGGTCTGLCGYCLATCCDGACPTTCTGYATCSVQCPAGQYVSGSGCVVCPVNTYKSGLNTDSGCSACPVHSSSNGATALQAINWCTPNTNFVFDGTSSFVCAPGYAYDSDACAACTPGSYKSAAGNTGCTSACPSTSVTTLATAATQLSHACQCPQGFYGLDDAALPASCVPCPPDTYKNAAGNGGSTVCTPCPLGSTTGNATARTSPTACVAQTNFTATSSSSYACLAGYGFDGTQNTCSACAAGSYSSFAGVSACVACPGNSTASGTTAATSASAACACSAGFYGLASASVSVCTACPAGTFKSSSGNGPASTCTACPAGSTTLAPGQSSAAACVATTGFASDGMGGFACAAGFYNVSGNCVPCLAGTYKSAVGNASCTSCVSLQASPVLQTYGSTTADAACACNAGHYNNSGVCSTCPSSTYKSTTGNDTCHACGAPSSAVLPLMDVLQCAQSGSTRMSGGLCQPGAYVSGSSCANCTTNQYLGAVTANTSCNSCPTGTTVINVAGGVNVDSICRCSAGRYAVKNTTTGVLLGCPQCAANTTQLDTANVGSCVPCGGGSYSASGDPVCTALAGFVSSGLNTFVCAPGYGLVAATQSCAPCAAGTYKATAGNVTCTGCPVSSAAVAGASGSTAVTQACQCSAGFSGLTSALDAECRPCVLDTYSTGNGSALCVACPWGTTTNGTAGASAAAQCVALPGYNVATAGSAAACDAGFYLVGSACMRCPIGTFKVNASNATNCTTCPTGSLPSNTTGSATPDQACQCPAGYSGLSTDPASTCASCSANFFKTQVGNDACSSCKTHGVTMGVTGSTNASVCVCDTGYYNDGVSCRSCGEDSYKDTTSDSNMCTACPSGTTTNGVTNASAVGQCQCAAGTYGTTGSCQSCPANTYKGWGYASACTNCPYGSSTNGATGAQTSAACTALPGFTSDGNGAFICAAGYQVVRQSCVACPSDYYKSSGGNASCVGCSAGQTTRGRTGMLACLLPTTVFNGDLSASASAASSSTSAGVIAGPVVACFAFVGLVGGGAYYMIQRRNQQSDRSHSRSQTNVTRGTGDPASQSGGHTTKSNGGDSTSSASGSRHALANGTTNFAAAAAPTINTGRTGSSANNSNNGASNNKNWNLGSGANAGSGVLAGFAPILAPGASGSTSTNNWRHAQPLGPAAANNQAWNSMSLEATISSVSAMAMMLMTRTQVVMDGPIVAFPAFLTVDSDSGYRKLKRLGEGGFAVLYKGELLDRSIDPSSSRNNIVAIKVFKYTNEDEKADIMTEFENEASIMYALQNSPNVAKLLALAREPELALMMKLYDESMARMIHSSNSAMMPKVLLAADGSYMRALAALTHDLVSAVRFMHTVGVAHLDIKPGNMLLESVPANDVSSLTGFPYRLVVCDFGLAKLVSETHVVKGRRRNLAHGLSIHYAAPEAFRIVRMMESGCIVNPQSLYKMDVFSVSSSVYEFVYRQVPFNKQSFNEIENALARGDRPPRVGVQPPDGGRDLAIWKDMATIVDLGWPQNPLNRSELNILWELLNVTVRNAGFSPGVIRPPNPTTRQVPPNARSSAQPSANRGALFALPPSGPSQ